MESSFIFYREPEIKTEKSNGEKLENKNWEETAAFCRNRMFLCDYFEQICWMTKTWLQQRRHTKSGMIYFMQSAVDGHCMASL